VQLEEIHLGESTFNYWPDSSAHNNREQGTDFVTSVMYSQGVKCVSCHDPHCTDNDELLVKPGSQMCLVCHGSHSSKGARGRGTLEQHTHHTPESAGSDGLACRMSRIATEIAASGFTATRFASFHPLKRFGTASPIPAVMPCT
jgi:predicted CXXCH cytochrome family protein